MQHRTSLGKRCLCPPSVMLNSAKTWGTRQSSRCLLVKLTVCTSLSLHKMCSLTVSYNLGSAVSEMYFRPGKQYLGSKCSIKRRNPTFLTTDRGWSSRTINSTILSGFFFFLPLDCPQEVYLVTGRRLPEFATVGHSSFPPFVLVNSSCSLR